MQFPESGPYLGGILPGEAEEAFHRRHPHLGEFIPGRLVFVPRYLDFFQDLDTGEHHRFSERSPFPGKGILYIFHLRGNLVAVLVDVARECSEDFSALKDPKRPYPEYRLPAFELQVWEWRKTQKGDYRFFVCSSTGLVRAKALRMFDWGGRIWVQAFNDWCDAYYGFEETEPCKFELTAELRGRIGHSGEIDKRFFRASTFKLEKGAPVYLWREAPDGALPLRLDDALSDGGLRELTKGWAADFPIAHDIRIQSGLVIVWIGDYYSGYGALVFNPEGDCVFELRPSDLERRDGPPSPPDRCIELRYLHGTYTVHGGDGKFCIVDPQTRRFTFSGDEATHVPVGQGQFIWNAKTAELTAVEP